MLSDISVRRPVFAAVMAIILCVVGLAAFMSLPVRELPSVDPPIVGVSVTYTGASAEVVEERITQVIERQVSGIQGIDRVTSSSRDGQSRITIQFTLDRNLDAAANDVRDAVSRAARTLPLQADPAQISKANADQTAPLTCEDGNGRAVFSKPLAFTDFPLDTITLWFTNNTILLPSEY